jgi:hypothetical protein
VAKVDRLTTTVTVTCLACGQSLWRRWISALGVDRLHAPEEARDDSSEPPKTKLGDFPGRLRLRSHGAEHRTCAAIFRE